LRGRHTRPVPVGRLPGAGRPRPARHPLRLPRRVGAVAGGRRRTGRGRRGGPEVPPPPPADPPHDRPGRPALVRPGLAPGPRRLQVDATKVSTWVTTAASIALGQASPRTRRSRRTNASRTAR